MSKATVTNTTTRRLPKDAATVGLMLLKASIKGLDGEFHPAVSTPRIPVLTGGAVRALELA